MIAPEINTKVAESASFSSAFQNPGAARVLEIFLSKIFLSRMSVSKGREDKKISAHQPRGGAASFSPAQSGINSALHR
jgi:hypothetical protein